MLLLELFPELSLRPKNLKSVKDLILQLAIQGKLTAKWREENPNIEPASELLQRIKEEKERLVQEKKIRKVKALTSIERGEIPFEIPDRWEWVRLSSLVSIINGDRGKNYPSKANYVSQGVPFITAGNILNSTLDRSQLNYISTERFALLRSGQIQDGDILFCLRGSLGKSAVISDIDEGAIASSLCIVRRFSELIHNDYLHLYFKSPINEEMITRHDNGTAQPNLSAGNLRKFVFPVAPLKEQKQIVRIVDQLFDEVDQLEKLGTKRLELKNDFAASALHELTNSDNTAESWNYLKPYFKEFMDSEENINKLKETVLQLAIQGKLTAKWREVNPALSLSQQTLTTSAPWEMKELADVANINGGFAFKSSDFKEEGTRVIRISDFDEKGFRDHKIVYLEYLPEHEKFVLEAGDILMAMTGGTVGKTLFVQELPEQMMVNQRVATIRVSSPVVSRFVYMALSSPDIKGVINEAKNSTNDNISMGLIKGFRIPVPPIDEQQEIVRIVDELNHLINELQKRCEEKADNNKDLVLSLIANLN